MNEELQPLIDRIQQEAVNEAQEKSEQIIEKARREAGRITREADEKAKRRLKEAEEEAEKFTERSIKTLEQASRDLLLTVGKGVEDIVSQIVAEDVREALTTEVLGEMLVKLSESCGKDSGEQPIEVLLSPDDKDKLVKYFAERYSDKMTRGVELKSDGDIFKGFKISFAEGNVYHEFTYEAIAEAISHFLRPHLAEIVRRVASEKPGSINNRGEG